MSRQQAYYWKRKFLDPDFHSQILGQGAKHKYTEEQRNQIKMSLSKMVSDDASLTLKEYSRRMAVLYPDLLITHHYVARIFRSWQWTWKVPEIRQMEKYSEENLQRYKEFLAWRIATEDTRIVFMDEAHFASRNLWRKKAIGPRGQRVIKVHSLPIDESFTITLMTCLTSAYPVSLCSRKGTNSSDDFLGFLKDVLEAGKIQPNSILVIDNARVHTAHGIGVDLNTLCEQYRFQLYYLPAYSPELNPCELVFAKVKNQLRTMIRTLPLFQEVIKLLANITNNEVSHYYQKCLMLD